MHVFLLHFKCLLSGFTHTFQLILVCNRDKEGEIFLLSAIAQMAYISPCEPDNPVVTQSFTTVVPNLFLFTYPHAEKNKTLVPPSYISELLH